ncbi:DsrE family protein [Aliiglaciecola sp. 3_MG-2023]|uniref:DsrE family protein n=1 Tax=Aliiglaciecola sp. 3_MG-2023 TaxID=3062644 RepID=UPI0026E2387A|nr:DsrE family protein [Aliiglaciecola sp. 3_MG-2023]MDO6695458.1 DsrE family protein [Aliiglaciecola sp. 3_MG-2023]
MKQFLLMLSMLLFCGLGVLSQSIAAENKAAKASSTVTSSNSTGRFTTGPVIRDFGKHAKVQVDQAFDPNTEFKVAFDVSKVSGEQKLNRHFVSLARFLNMLVANGAKQENIHLALVVHGSAGNDLLNPVAYKKRFAGKNPNHPLIADLLENNVEVYLCGQSAAFHEVSNSDLIEGVQMSLSAMTAHALLDQRGYSLNPF